MATNALATPARSKKRKWATASTAEDHLNVYNGADGTSGLNKNALSVTHNPDYGILDSEDSFRVMYLQPGSGGDDLVVHLQTVSLDEAPVYEAISYVWGDAKRQRVIRSNIGLLYVTPSLTDVLRVVRYPDRPRCLWADAICINQADLLERSHQVKHMATLYAAAEHVLIWLGPDDDGRGRRAFECAHRLCLPSAYSEISLKPERLRDAIEVLSALKSRPWFHRMWTTQELGMASQAICLCGQSSLSWDVLSEAYTFIIVQSQYDHIKPAAPLSFERDLSVFLQNWSKPAHSEFRRLVDAVQGRLTTDPRDRIFALLAHPSALVDEGHSRSRRFIVDPDYRLSLREVYLKAAQGMILQSCNLDVLSHVQIRAVPVERRILPSWVPNWNERSSATPLIDYFSGSWSGARVGHDLPTFTSEGALCAGGFCCVQVARVLSDHRLDSVLAIQRELQSAQRALLRLDPTWQHKFKTIEEQKSPDWAKVLLSHLVRDQETAEGDASGLDPSRLRSVQEIFDAVGDVPDKAGQFEQTLRDIARFTKKRDSRRLIVTTAGELGLALHGGTHDADCYWPQPGDSIFLLDPGRVPYILRPNKDTSYRFVGNCYVRSLIGGSAHERSTWPHQKIVIK